MKTTRSRATVALLALVGCVGLLWLADFAPHTDDGCQVEIHCLTCRTAVVRAATAAHVDVAPVLVALADAAASIGQAVPHGVRAPSLTRGPPLSL